MTENDMTENDASLDDILEPTETPHPDRHEHAKTPHRVNDDELAERTEHEREEIAEDQRH